MRSSVCRTWAAIVLVAVVAFQGAAAAQSHEASEQASQEASEQASQGARTLFREGLDFADHGDWERAVQRFRQALDLRESGPIRYNLAQSLVHMGRLVEALDELAVVLADESLPDDVREDAASLRDHLRSRLGRLTVRVRGPHDDDLVTIDGRPLPPAAIDHPTPTDPGVRVARLVRGSEEIDLQEVDVPSGGDAEVVLEAEEPVSAPAAALEASPAAQASGSDDAWIWAVVIGAVLVAAGGAVLVGWAVSESGPQPSMGDFAPPVLEFD